MIDDVLKVLGDEHQLDLTVTEIVDILWLAQQKWRSPSGALSQVVLDDEREDEENSAPGNDRFGNNAPMGSLDISSGSSSLPPAGLKFRQSPPTELESADIEDEGTPIAIPDAPALRHKLELLRALKPLFRKVPSLERTRLNERATAQWIAETDVWIPTLEAEMEPWLDLALVVDATPSMLVWQQTVRELQRLLRQVGMFRDVRLWSLHLNASNVEVRPGYGPDAVHLSPCSPKELVDPSRRRLIWIVSDCIDNRWQTGILSSALKVWVNQGPLALVQMLPESMWSRTRLQTVVKAQFHAESLGSPSQTLKVIQRRDRWRQSSDAMLQVPVFTLEFDSCWRWSCMVVAQRDNRAAGLLFSEQAQPEWQRPSLTPEARVETFNLFCSPLAGRLARLLSGCPEVTLPLIRVIQDAMVPTSTQIHVAEVLYGGILKPTQVIEPYADPDTTVYIFHDIETQRQLARDVIPEETFKALSRWIEHRLGRSLDKFVAVLENPQADLSLAVRTHAFAGIAIETLLRQDRRYLSTAEAYLQRWILATLNLSSLDQFVEHWTELTQLDGLAQTLTPVAEILIIVLRFKGERSAQVAVELRQFLQEGQLPVVVNASVADTDFPPLQELVFEKVHVSIGRDETDLFPDLQVHTFDVLEISVDPTALNFQEIEFDVATLEHRRYKWVVTRQPARNQQYIENLSDDVGLEMVAISAGQYMMGEGKQQHEVTVPAFYMGKYQVSQVQWKAVAAMEQVDRELDPDPSCFKGDDLPVERVLWDEAIEFCQRLSTHTNREYRLPSEAEWEYACRAGTTTSFHFGEMITTEVANYNGSAYNKGPKGKRRGKTIAVGSLNAPNPFGLYDMHGNIFEWCQDHWHDDYQGAPLDGSAWQEEDPLHNNGRVIRGGSWDDPPRYCRSAYRFRDDSAYRINDLGFRVVASAPFGSAVPKGWTQ